MIPTRFVVVSKLPLFLVSEKVNEQKLAEHILYELDKPTTHSLNEHSLSSIIGQSLGKQINDHYTSLFDMGLDSLRAIHLVALITKSFKVDLSLADILQYNTVHSLLNCIQQHKKNQHKQTTPNQYRVVPLKNTGNKSPLFVIHPLGGGVFWYQYLSLFLPTDRPMYALQDPSLEHPDQTLFHSITEMASAYIKGIKRKQSHGPYYVAGASFGATVALEVAHQLESAGDKVAFIGLFDGWKHYDNSIDQAFIEHSAQSNLEQYSSLFGHDTAGLNSSWHTTLQLHRSSLLADHAVAYTQCIPTLYKAETLVAPFDSFDNPYNHWQSIYGQTIPVFLIPGTHYSMFTPPHVEQLAKHLNQSLQEAHLSNQLNTEHLETAPQT